MRKRNTEGVWTYSVFGMIYDSQTEHQRFSLSCVKKVILNKNKEQRQTLKFEILKNECELNSINVNNFRLNPITGC